MVCPNCKSDQIIQVQDQHFCINCGQQVPDPPPKKVKSTAGVAVQANGLPEGVQILPVTAPPAPAAPAHADPKPDTKSEPNPEPERETAPDPQPTPDPAPQPVPVIKTRARLRSDSGAADDNAKPTDGSRPKRRKPGRPKSGPLDTPRGISLATPATAPAAPLPAAPKITQAPADPIPKPDLPSPPPRPSAPDGPRRISDISPRRPQTKPAAPQTEPPDTHSKSPKKAKEHHNVHKVGVPPLHYGAVLAFSLRARMRPRLFALAAVAALSFAAAAGYGAWLLATGGLPRLTLLMTAGGQKVIIEIALLAALYYIGRSISQAAITYGVARDADNRPVSLTRQFGVGINTFGRRLTLDLVFALLELGLLAVMAGLVLAGGESWPVNLQLQVAAIFAAFLLLLYLETSLAIARGLAGVALTLTPDGPAAAAKLGWRLFSHRFELLGLRFVAVALELVLALPLAAVAAALIADAPPHLRLEVALAVGLLAWVAGALFGAGTAAWWASLYRRLVLVDRPDGAVSLLSGRHPQDARRGPLALIVSLTSLLIAAILALPWLNFL
jgi:hypothetical protein